jgi:hypothetical protein
LRLRLVFAVAPKHLTRRGGRGNVGIRKGFPKSVEREESRLYGFPCFPYSVISIASPWGRGQNVKVAEIPVFGAQLFDPLLPTSRNGQWIFGASLD